MQICRICLSNRVFVYRQNKRSGTSLRQIFLTRMPILSKWCSSTKAQRKQHLNLSDCQSVLYRLTDYSLYSESVRSSVCLVYKGFNSTISIQSSQKFLREKNPPSVEKYQLRFKSKFCIWKGKVFVSGVLLFELHEKIHRTMPQNVAILGVMTQ